MQGLNAAFFRAVLKSKTDFCDSFIAFKTQTKQNPPAQSLQVSDGQILWTCADFSQLSIYQHGYSWKSVWRMLWKIQYEVPAVQKTSSVKVLSSPGKILFSDLVDLLVILRITLKRVGLKKHTQKIHSRSAISPYTGFLLICFMFN